MENRNPFGAMAQTRTQTATMDLGLRKFMLGIYNYMASALALTGIVSLLAVQSEAVMGALYQIEGGMLMGMKPLGWIVAFAPLAMALLLGFGVQRMSVQGAKLAFWSYAALMGLSLASIFLIYTGESIARTFFITAGVFGGMSLYGYTTKRDLTGIGSFLIMGVWGLILASIVNIFLQSSMMSFIISAAGVLIFVGLTAYDTQKLKHMYYAVAGSAEQAAKMSIMGALTLYLDFINLFIMLLRFVGERR